MLISEYRVRQHQLFRLTCNIIVLHKAIRLGRYNSTMAPTYKLTYFAVRAVAEPIRFLLSYGNQEFQDVRLEMDDWKAIKDSSPFGKLPMLEVDGKVVHQSLAICRYLAKQFNLVGDNDWEALLIDIAVDTINDMKTPIGDHFKFGFYGGDAEGKAKMLVKLTEETLPYYLTKFEEIVRDNGGYFVNSKLTWADIYWAAHADSMTVMLGSDMLKDYPHLRGLHDKVHAIPAIKAWVDQRETPELLI